MRIVTRGDFDSLISSVLLSHVHAITDVRITSLSEFSSNNFEITKNDIIANLPYHNHCGFWFDHHINENQKASETNFKGSFNVAPSCSRVIFDYYKNTEGIEKFEKIVYIADKIDSALFTQEDIQNPHNWYIIDRTLHAFDPQGRLGNFQDYFMKLIHWIKSYSLSEILLSDEVQSRIEHVRSEHKVFVEVLKECSRVDSNVVITDSRKIRYFPNGNRYFIYTLFPVQNVSVSIFNKRDSDYSVIFCGHNIFNRTCKTEINTLLKKYNGSGRVRAGSCTVKQEKADAILNDIITELKNNE